MQFYYTGNKQPRLPQLLPERSLGGYVSISEVPDGLLSNLFDQVSLYTQRTNKPEYRVIALFNDDNVTYSGLQAWVEYNNQSSDEIDAGLYQIGFATFKTDNCGDLYVDSLGNTQAAPRGVTLVDAPSEGFSLALPNLEAGMYVAFYLKRTLNPAFLAPLSDTDLQSIRDGLLTLPIEENVLVQFAWT